MLVYMKMRTENAMTVAPGTEKIFIGSDKVIRNESQLKRRNISMLGSLLLGAQTKVFV